MKGSRLYAEIGAETAHAYILAVLTEKFGQQAADACRDAVERLTNEDKLRRLHLLAIRCDSIKSFQKGLRAR